MADIQMPQLGETVTEGTITKWFKAVGDQVAEDEPLFEVSTDKVDSEVPSPTSGFLAEIKVEEGETVDVGTLLAVVSDRPADGGTGPEEEAAGGSGGTALEQEASEQAEAEEQAAEAETPSEQETTEPEAEPEAPTAEPEAEPEQIDAKAEPEPASSAEAQADNGGGGGGSGLVLSPVVRRLISEHNLDPATIEGTGTGGRITRSDVLRIVEGASAPTTQPAASAPAPAAKAAPAPAPAPTAAKAAPAPVVAPKATEADTVVALNNIRRRTGEHMVRSKATSPHVLTVMEVDYEAVEQARRSHREAFKAQEGFSLTYLPFIARSLIDALGEFPHMNATVGEGELIVHNTINLGIAVDLQYEGLIVPVIHDAQDRRLRAIARSISDLANRARGKKLSADDISGGTVTITNAGQYGTTVQMAVINQPQVMILSTEGVTRKPVVVTDSAGQEAIAIHSVGNLSMTWDHRAFDGAYAAAFLRRVCEILETRDWSSEL